MGACYRCPLTNVDFRGSCPITPCNYNITNYKTERSCCLAIETQKTEFDKWDLQEALGISESKLYKLKEKGELQVKALIAFYSILNNLRDKNIPVKSTEKIANFIDNSYLNVEEIQARKSDIYLIQENLDTIQEQALKIDPRLTLERVLGTTEKITT